MDTSILLALIAFVAYGVSAVLFKVAGADADGFTITLIATICLTFVAFIGWLFAHKTSNVKGIALSAVGGIILGIGFLAFIVGVTKGKVSIVSAIRGLSIGLTALIAMLFLGEKISLVNAAGMLLAVVAIVLLSL